MKTKEELIAERQELLAKANRITGELRKRKNDSETIGVWKPKQGEQYFYIDSCGIVNEPYWVGNFNDHERLEYGNCFRTREEAERQAMRIKSMKPTWLPEKGDKYYYILINYILIFTHGPEIEHDVWLNDKADAEYYYLGRVFRTEEEAQTWIDTFGKYFTEL